MNERVGTVSADPHVHASTRGLDNCDSITVSALLTMFHDAAAMCLAAVANVFAQGRITGNAIAFENRMTNTKNQHKKQDDQHGLLGRLGHQAAVPADLW